jgi:AcrR family transcriptional regulator
MAVRDAAVRSENRRSRAKRTRAEILAAASIRFAELGYAGTRLEDVGQDVGIGRSAVLYHFKDKSILYRSVLDEIFGDLLEEQTANLETDRTLADRLETAVDQFVDFMGAHPTAARIALRESLQVDPAIRLELQKLAAPFFALLDAIFREGERTGVFRPMHSDPFHFVSVIAGSTLFYVAALPNLVGQLPYDPLSREQLDDHKRDLIEITRRLLGILGPRMISDHSETTH